MRFAELKNVASGLGCFCCGAGDTEQEEPKPTLPISVLSDRHESVVVLGPTLLEKCTEIQDWPVKNSAMVKQKCNQQAPDPAIAVQKWMDGLKLCMGESTMDENGQRSLLVEKPFEVIERVSH